MKLTLLLIMSGIAVANMAFAAIGGEIGNGRYIRYENKIANFEIFYPIEWNKFELDQNVSFIESKAKPEDRSRVSIAVESLPNVDTLGALLKTLQIMRPFTRWHETEIGGLRGYQGFDDDGEVAYLVRKPGEAIVLHQRARATQSAQEDVKTILESLQFN